MKMLVALALALLIALGLIGTSAAVSGPTCVYGRVQGFISIRSDPVYLVGTIPNQFTANADYFARRYNCKRKAPQVRRVDLGVYDVRFSELGNRAPIATAFTDGVVASVQGLDDGTYRVYLRGPVVQNGVLIRRDVPFSLAVF